MRVVICLDDMPILSHDFASCSHQLRHGHISPAKFRLYNKYKEINSVLIQEDIISGN